MREIPGLEDAILVLSFESNLAFESQHLLKAFERNNIKRWVALSEGAGGTLGWLTTNERKEAMCLQVRDALTVGSISLSSHFFSVKMDVKDALKALGNEMRAFAILVEPPKTTFGKVRRCAAASPRAPLPTPLPATGPQDVLGQGGRRAGRWCAPRRHQHHCPCRR